MPDPVPVEAEPTQPWPAEPPPTDHRVEPVRTVPDDDLESEAFGF